MAVTVYQTANTLEFPKSSRVIGRSSIKGTIRISRGARDGYQIKEFPEMKRRRVHQPSFQRLEERTVLSLSFGNLMHSIFPFIHSSTDSKPAPHMTAAQRSDLIQKRWADRTAAATQTSPKPQILAGTHLPTAKIHSAALQQFLNRHQVAQPSSASALK